MKTEEELMELLKTDVDEFNDYRKKTNYIYIDLRSADFYGADLRGANLREADLRGADFRGATINKSHIKPIIDLLDIEIA